MASVTKGQTETWKDKGRKEKLAVNDQKRLQNVKVSRLYVSFSVVVLFSFSPFIGLYSLETTFEGFERKITNKYFFCY
jgi:hypothetical protein